MEKLIIVKKKSKLLPKINVSTQIRFVSNRQNVSFIFQLLFHIIVEFFMLSIHMPSTLQIYFNLIIKLTSILLM